MKTVQIHYKVESYGDFEPTMDVFVPGRDRGENHDLVIIQGDSRLYISRNQLNDLIFILGQAKKEYGLPD